MNTECEENKVSYYFCGMIMVFIVTFVMTYKIYQSSDFGFHASMALQLNRHIFEYMKEYISYPLWHILVKFIYKFFEFSIETSVAGATALFNCAAGGGNSVCLETFEQQPAEYHDRSDMDVFYFGHGTAVCADI